VLSKLIPWQRSQLLGPETDTSAGTHLAVPAPPPTSHLKDAPRLTVCNVLEDPLRVYPSLHHHPRSCKELPFKTTYKLPNSWVFSLPRSRSKIRFSIFVCFAVLGMESRASHMLGKRSPSEPHASPIVYLLIISNPIPVTIQQTCP
jgi:hypothetical protein